jgi:hypothetical protein
VAFVWLALRRKAAGWLLGGWVLTLVVLANPYTFLRLPGTGLVNNFTIQIALYLPLAALVAVALADLGGWIGRRRAAPGRPLGVAAALAVLLLALPGIWEATGEVEPAGYAMAFSPDLRAAAWIEENTPEDAVFHINGFPAFGGTAIAGSDGGWWLWYGARRATTVPPMLYDTERSFEPQYREQVVTRFLALEAVEQEPAALAARLRDYGISHVYIGARQGQVGLTPGEMPLDAVALATSDQFQLLYTDGLVWVFEVEESGQ